MMYHLTFHLDKEKCVVSLQIRIEKGVDEKDLAVLPEIITPEGWHLPWQQKEGTYSMDVVCSSDEAMEIYKKINCSESAKPKAYSKSLTRDELIALAYPKIARQKRENEKREAGYPTPADFPLPESAYDYPNMCHFELEHLSSEKLAKTLVEYIEPHLKEKKIQEEVRLPEVQPLERFLQEHARLLSKSKLPSFTKIGDSVPKDNLAEIVNHITKGGNRSAEAAVNLSWVKQERRFFFWRKVTILDTAPAEIQAYRNSKKC